jgi:hypothetical protein
MAFLDGSMNIAATGYRCSRNRKGALKIVLENPNLRFRLQKPLEDPCGSLFHERRNVRIAEGACNELKLHRVPANPQ